MDVRGRVRAGLQRRLPYEPGRYWRLRARDYIDGMRDPESWAGRGWITSARSVEEATVPGLFRDGDVQSVVVAGCGTGIQYGYLLENGFAPRGFDISWRLVREARRQHPDVESVVGDVVGCEARHGRADAVLSTTVLQHVPPAKIQEAVLSLQAVAQKMIVLVELTRFDGESKYQFAHDYDRLFAGWELVRRELAQEGPLYRTELLAWRSP